MVLKTKQPLGPDGKPATIEFDGEEFVLPKFTATMITRVRDEVARRKRRDLLRQIAELRESLPPAFWQREWKRAKAEAEAITSGTVTPDEIGTWLDTREGTAFSLHLLIEKVSPGRFELAEVQLLVDEKLDDAFAELLVARDAVAPDVPKADAPAPAEAATDVPAAPSAPPVSLASAASDVAVAG